MRAQISAECLIMLAVVAGVAVFMMSSLMTQSKAFAGKMNQSSDFLMKKIDSIINSS